LERPSGAALAPRGTAVPQTVSGDRPHSVRAPPPAASDRGAASADGSLKLRCGYCGRIDNVSMVAAAVLLALIAASDVNRGIVLYRQRQFEAAKAELTQALLRSPKDTTARLYLARTLVELRRIPEALAEVERALAGNADPEALFQAGRL